MTFRSKKLTLLILLIFLLQTLSGIINVSAAELTKIGDTYYSLSQKKYLNFSDGSMTGYTNDIGYYGTETIDETHGLSAVIGAESNVDITKEGAWLSLPGDNNLKKLVMDFEFYSDGLEDGIIKFMLRTKKGSSNLPVYFMGMDKNGILFDNDSNTYKFSGDESTRISASFRQWHKMRLFVDMTDFSYSFYMDDMTNAVASGKIDVSGVNSIDSLRIILMDEDTFAAVDNYRLYSVSEIEAGYTPPALSLRQISERITESEECEIAADIETSTEITSVDFYIDGSKVYTDTEAPYVLKHLFEAGNYSVKAIATDKYGQTGESGELAVVSLKDTKPKITMTLADGETVDRTKLSNVVVTVEVSDTELKTAYIALGEEIISELFLGENTVDLSSLSIGIHEITVYAENILSESKTVTVTVEVTKNFEDIVYTENYESFTGANGILGSNNMGYRSGEIIRDDFGYSAVIGAEGTVDTSKEGSWLGITLGKCTSTAEVSYDWYFSALRGSAVVQMRTSAGVVKPLFTVTSSGVASTDGKQTYAFNAEHWYKVRLTIDIVKQTYSLYLDDSGAIINQSIDYPVGSIMDSIRLVSKLSGEPKTYFAVDNTVVRHLLYAPMITGVESENSFAKNTVFSADKEILIYFSGGLEGSSIYPSKFSLTSGNEVVNVTSAQYDANDLFVKLGFDTPLKSGKTYRITVGENVVMSNGALYGEELYFDFKAERSPFEADNLSVSEDGVFSADITNKTSGEKSFYILVNVYEGGYLAEKYVKELKAQPGTDTVFETIPGYTSEKTADVMLWDSLDVPYCFSYIEN